MPYCADALQRVAALNRKGSLVAHGLQSDADA